MYRGLRVEVAEAEYVVVFEHDVGGDFAADDFAEDGVGHGAIPSGNASDYSGASGLCEAGLGVL